MQWIYWTDPNVVHLCLCRMWQQAWYLYTGCLSCHQNLHHTHRNIWLLICAGSIIHLCVCMYGQCDNRVEVSA